MEDKEVLMAFGKNVSDDFRVYRLTLRDGTIIENVPEQLILDHFGLERAADVTGKIWDVDQV